MWVPQIISPNILYASCISLKQAEMIPVVDLGVAWVLGNGRGVGLLFGQ